MKKQQWYIRKYFKGRVLGTTGVLYEDENRVKRDFNALTEKAVPFVKYEIVGPIIQ